MLRGSVVSLLAEQKMEVRVTEQSWGWGEQ